MVVGSAKPPLSTISVPPLLMVAALVEGGLILSLLTLALISRSTNLVVISRTIASHKKWDATDLAMGGPGDRHFPETGDWIKAIENCKRIYEKKCRSDYDSCRPCKFVKEAGPVGAAAYIIYKIAQILTCPESLPFTP